VETLELIMALPVLVLAFVAALQYGLMMVVHHSVAAAAQDGARVAERCGADTAKIQSAVDRALSAHSLAVGPGVRVLVQDDTGTVSSVGDASLTTSRTAVPPAAGELRVVVLVAMAQAPVPNALAGYGLDFAGDQYEASTVVLEP
jgi:hypothetical protein